jgi:colanic acid/amylovoran biosynthesis protein
LKILLSAYLDHNLGDDLFVDYFSQVYAQHEIHLLCDDTMRLNVQLESRPALHKIGLKQAAKSVLSFDALVIIGGSIFQENPAFYKYDYRRNALVTLFRAAGRKVCIVGCNIGPVRTAHGRRIFKYCFTLANSVSVRDSASLALLQQWRIRRNYGLAPDLVFSYPYQPRSVVRSGHRLGISVINRGAKAEGGAAYVAKLVRLADRYLQGAPDREVALFGFDGGMENDGAVIDTIAAALAPHGARVIRQQYGVTPAIRDYLDVFSDCDYMVCSRFHSLVLALKHGIPFFPISYSEKMTNLLRDIGYDRALAHYASMDAFDVDEVMNDITSTAPRFRLDPAVIEASRGHFERVDRFLS